MSVLNEKDIPYEITYIDLRNKPDWFLEISPTGKVPVLQTADGTPLFESAVINEFLDESHEPQFLPTTPLERAYERMWNDFVAGLYGDVYHLYNASDAETADSIVDGLQAKLAKLEGEIDGPLFNGDRFGLVDATAAPPFMRLGWIERIVPDLDIFANAPKARAWQEALLERPSVQGSVLPNLYEIFVGRLREQECWLATRLAMA